MIQDVADAHGAGFVAEEPIAIEAEISCVVARDAAGKQAFPVVRSAPVPCPRHIDLADRSSPRRLRWKPRGWPFKPPLRSMWWGCSRQVLRGVISKLRSIRRGRRDVSADQ
ncbi:MAG: hypothetical protein R3E66_08970 [bacterium]